MKTEALAGIHTTLPVSSGKPLKYKNPFPLEITSLTSLTHFDYAAA
jgi:hypothetical protein